MRVVMLDAPGLLRMELTDDSPRSHGGRPVLRIRSALRPRVSGDYRSTDYVILAAGRATVAAGIVASWALAEGLAEQHGAAVQEFLRDYGQG